MIKRCYVFHPLTSTLLELLLFMSPPMLQTQLFWAYFNQLKMDTQMPQPQPTRSNERALSRCTTGQGTPIDYRASLVGCQIRGQSPVSMQWQWQCGVRQRASRGDNYILTMTMARRPQSLIDRGPQDSFQILCAFEEVLGAGGILQRIWKHSR